MAHILHQCGDKYRVWSTIVDEYLSPELTAEQVSAWSAVSEVHALLHKFLYDGAVYTKSLEMEAWIKRARQVSAWKEDGDLYEAVNQDAHTIQAQKNLLKFLYENWEKLNDGTFTTKIEAV